MQKTSKRLTGNPNIPKTLTPKGYTKASFIKSSFIKYFGNINIIMHNFFQQMQLMMSIAQKKYDNIVKKLKGSGQLWEDPEFPPSAAIGQVGNLPRVEWKRPKEINPKAEFIVDGFDRSDVAQGRLGK